MRWTAVDPTAGSWAVRSRFAGRRPVLIVEAVCMRFETAAIWATLTARMGTGTIPATTATPPACLTLLAKPQVSLIGSILREPQMSYHRCLWFKLTSSVMLAGVHETIVCSWLTLLGRTASCSLLLSSLHAQLVQHRRRSMGSTRLRLRQLRLIASQRPTRKGHRSSSTWRSIACMARTKTLSHSSM